ncbi:MAG: glycosyltransferase [Candidatus Moraniibacteriota bacterium]|nr:MAG: glycosyltransferase [Candidatus Moranbacteria bacterium]
MKIVFLESTSQKMVTQPSFVHTIFFQKLLDDNHKVICLVDSIHREKFLLNEFSKKGSSFSVKCFPQSNSFFKNKLISCKRFLFLFSVKADIVDVCNDQFILGSLLLHIFRPSLVIIRRVNQSFLFKKKTFTMKKLYQMALSSSYGIIADSERSIRYVRKISQAKSILLPKGKSYEISETRIKEFFEKKKNIGLKQKSYIVCVSDFASHPDGLHSLLRSFEKLYATNRIANNTSLVVVTESLSQEQKTAAEILSLTQPLLLFFEDGKDRDVLLSQSIACVVEKCDSDFFFGSVEDAAGFGIPIVFLTEKTPSSFRGMALPYEGDMALFEKLAYVLNVPKNTIATFLTQSKLRIHRKFGFGRIAKRTISLYNETLILAKKMKKNKATQQVSYSKSVRQL